MYGDFLNSSRKLAGKPVSHSSMIVYWALSVITELIGDKSQRLRLKPQFVVCDGFVHPMHFELAG